MQVGIPKETSKNETRVAAVPETVAKMVNAGMDVMVEADAGLSSFISNADYIAAGARIVDNCKHLYQAAEVILKVNPPVIDNQDHAEEIAWMQPAATLIAPLQAHRHPALIAQLSEKKITAFAVELLPRIARAQSMDILSSMSNLAGYKSVILAANTLGKIFPMLTTAAGTIQPAKVIVIGVGVAGLQAIATARRLGGVVIAFDTRPATEEQVKSLGADFVSLAVQHTENQDASGYAKAQSETFYQQEQAILQQYTAKADVIITTALIPGKKAPILITEAMVKEMKPGTVIVDLAAEQGGNCGLSEYGKIVTKHQVTIIGTENIPATLPGNASQLFARNLYAFLQHVSPMLNSKQLDLTDEIIKACLVTYQGNVLLDALKK